MRDEMDARIWTDAHDGFAESADQAVAALVNVARRIPVPDGTTVQLAALAVSFAITALTFNSTIV